MHHAGHRNDLRWEIYPEGINGILQEASRYRLPILITENGICTSDDQERWSFIQSHLIQVHKAIKSGITVIGYLYWSLLDNFEWAEGFGPRFGLVEVDYDSQARKVRESAQRYANVCATGELPLD